jgi:hypothetical protein
LPRKNAGYQAEVQVYIGRIRRYAPDRALRLYLLPDSPKRAKGYRFNPLRGN